VEDYISTVSKEISKLGTEVDPRYDSLGQRHQELKDQTAAYKKADPPPERVKPLPVQLIEHAVASLQTNEFDKAIGDLIILGFFFLLHPGEHTYSSDSEYDRPFRLQDVSFEIPNLGTTNGAAADVAGLHQASRVNLNFTNQKNGEKDECISHGDTDNALLSPLKAALRRIKHLRSRGAAVDTPLHTVLLPDGALKRVTADHINQALKRSCNSIGEQLGIQASDISARALRAGGAMALLRAKIDPTEIKIMGRWKSDAMMIYLHRSALDTVTFASKMLVGGRFTIARHREYPLPADVIDRISAYKAALQHAALQQQKTPPGASAP
jgi:hypothetical protein